MLLKDIHEARFLKALIQPFKENRQPRPARNGVAQLRHGDTRQHVIGNVLLGKERREKYENGADRAENTDASGACSHR